MAAQTINISLPRELVKKIDSAAKAEFASRSDYIRQALVGRLKATESSARTSDWLLLQTLSDEIAVNAERLGYSTDKDFARAVKESRQNRTKK